MAAELIARLATNVIELDKQLTEVDNLIADRFPHPPSHRPLNRAIGSTSRPIPSRKP